MKKMLICGMIVLSLFYLTNREPLPVANAAGELNLGPESLLRFHVLANSDLPEDQELKRQVRDKVVQAMIKKYPEAKSLEEAEFIVSKHLDEIEAMAQQVVTDQGSDYKVKAEIGTFSFPTKSYGKFALPAGDYRALRIVIGEGKGSNWWCVLFPPLCFVDLTHSLAANPALVANTASTNQSTLSEGLSEGSTKGIEAGEIEIRSALLEFLDKLFD